MIKPDNIPVARDKFVELLQNVDFNQPTPCDFVLNIDDLTIQFIQEIDKYDWLWGTGLKEPKVAIENILVRRADIHVQGKNFNSVAFMIDDIKLVHFNMTEDNPLLQWASAWDGEDNDTIEMNIVGQVSLNEYKGVYTPQVIIDDLEIINTIQN